MPSELLLDKPWVENTQLTVIAVLVPQPHSQAFQREEKIRPNNLSRPSLKLLSLAA